MAEQQSINPSLPGTGWIPVVIYTDGWRRPGGDLATFSEMAPAMKAAREEAEADPLSVGFSALMQ